jgi:hypothetical protein
MERLMMMMMMMNKKMGMVRPFSTRGMKAIAIENLTVNILECNPEVGFKIAEAQILEILSLYYSKNELVKLGFYDSDSNFCIKDKIDAFLLLIEDVYQEIKDVNKNGFVNKFDKNLFPKTSRVIEEMLAEIDDGRGSKKKREFESLNNMEKLELSK